MNGNSIQQFLATCLPDERIIQDLVNALEAADGFYRIRTTAGVILVETTAELLVAARMLDIIPSPLQYRFSVVIGIGSEKPFSRAQYGHSVLRRYAEAHRHSVYLRFDGSRPRCDMARRRPGISQPKRA